MKILTSMFFVALAVAVTGPALAEDVSTATTEAECADAGGDWDADADTCGPND